MWKSAQHSKHMPRKLSLAYHRYMCTMTFWSWGDIFKSSWTLSTVKSMQYLSRGLVSPVPEAQHFAVVPVA